MPLPDPSFDSHQRTEAEQTPDQSVTQPIEPGKEMEESTETDAQQQTEGSLVAEHTPQAAETDLMSGEAGVLDGVDTSGVTTQLNPDDVPALQVQYYKQGLSAAAVRDIGRVRETNQDSVFSLLTNLPYNASDLSLGLFIVADGMGGHEGGEIASRMAVSEVADHILLHLVSPMMQGEMSESLQSLMVAAVQRANRAIWEYAQSIGSDMGTTCTAVLLLGQSIYVAHVGDSRLYRFDSNRLEVVTNDHSMVGRLIQLEYLDPAEASQHPLRNQLYRTVGQQPDVEVDFIYQPLGDTTHMLLCSDGLWGMIPEEHIIEALTNSTWAQDMCHELIALANLAGGEDNISAIVVTLPVKE